MKMKSVKELLEVHGKAEKECYFDWENGSIVDTEVFNAMKPFFLEKGYGNPAITHRIGWESYEYYGIEKEKIANSLNVDSVNLALTFSSTESNNITVLGTTKLNKKRKKIVVSSVEHLSIMHAAKALYDQGIKVETIPVSHNGVVDLDILQEKLDENTLMVSLQSINHEIGTIQQVKEAIEIVKDKDENIYFHTDASAAYGRIQLDFLDLNVDFGTISSQKILGPKGIAGLYVKDGIKLKSIYEGELSVEILSPDVEYMPLLAGFAKAVEIQFNKFKEINEYTRKLRDKLMYGLQ
ncbi:MAG: aminotransferase class V-fold PLP-dependent enzyme, partial [Candidatus Heimdallarchaeota archaeon]|nr:aminotransferase class V-fold PLP-dependent enzyme [Candidatus Heimdallarchaeota archaeon]